MILAAIILLFYFLWAKLETIGRPCERDLNKMKVLGCGMVQWLAHLAVTLEDPGSITSRPECISYILSFSYFDFFWFPKGLLNSFTG
jgi:hypothetical protein